MDRPLDEIIRNADVTAGRVRVEDDLADRVFERVRARRLRRTVVRSTCALAIVAASLFAWTFPRMKTPIVSTERSMGELQASLAEIQTEANRREQLVNRLLTIERQSRTKLALQRRVRPPEPVQVANLEVEDAALVMVYQADRIAGNDSQASAQAIYREVVQYFPDTQWGHLARERITP